MARLGHAIETSQRGECEQARRLLTALWDEIGHDGDALHRVTLAHWMADVQDDPREELAWDLRALQAAESVTDERVHQAGATAPVVALYPSLHLNLGEDYRKLGDLAAARHHLQLGQAACASLGEDGYGQMIKGGLDAWAARLSTPHLPLMPVGFDLRCESAGRAGEGAGGLAVACGGVGVGEVDQETVAGAGERGREAAECVGELVDGLGCGDAGDGVAAPAVEVGGSVLRMTVTFRGRRAASFSSLTSRDPISLTRRAETILAEGGYQWNDSHPPAERHRHALSSEGGLGPIGQRGRCLSSASGSDA